MFQSSAHRNFTPWNYLVSDPFLPCLVLRFLLQQSLKLSRAWDEDQLRARPRRRRGLRKARPARQLKRRRRWRWLWHMNLYLWGYLGCEMWSCLKYWCKSLKLFVTQAKQAKQGKQFMKKAPGAPKRGKSAYICFTMAKRDEVKRQLGPEAKVGACWDSKGGFYRKGLKVLTCCCCIQVTDVMKFVADLWRQSSDQEKKYWEEVSLKDKERYQQELANYKGPLKVTSKR